MITDVVNKFNPFFIDSISRIRQSIDKAQYVNQVTCESRNLFKFRKIDITELENIVKQMKNKPDHECLRYVKNNRESRRKRK